MFLVVRRAVGKDGTGCGDQGGPDTGSRVPLRLFATRDAAKALVAQLTAEAHRTMNPFHLNEGMLPEPVRAELAKLDFPVALPKDSWTREWRLWWDRCQDLITDKLRAKVWKLVGAAPPFEVIRVALATDET
jgi:hypothetical protein